MAFDLSDCVFQGPALPEPFVKLELERELARRKLLPKTTGAEGRQLKDAWDAYRRKLRELVAGGGPLRVRNHVIEPLAPLLGYARLENADLVQTREDLESGGVLLVGDDGRSRLRVWTTGFNEDFFAPSKRGRAYRFGHLRVAQRVLLATSERVGLLTNGVHLVLLISDPARPDSTVTFPIETGWRRSRDLCDSFCLLLALASPEGVRAIPELVDKARLQQARVTKELRKQARQAVERFVQAVLDHPANAVWLAEQTDREALARSLWHEGLVTVYRLLFILKLESSDDPARQFSFASSALWRSTFSPTTALAPYVHDVLDRGVETGTLLESGVRALFRMFEQGLDCTELIVKPLGGVLFGRQATPILSELQWGERAVAHLLDRLLWTPRGRGAATRERVHYGPLDVEDLGRVYEALLELEPGIAAEPMCRLRRHKLEVVVPVAQGERYRPADAPRDADENENLSDGEGSNVDDNSDAESDGETPARGRATRVEWIEAIPPGRFYLRVGLGRKASGSYYTPHSFVRFLVQETLGPQVAERSPADNPQPLKILKLKVLDPAMGSGHFLVEACRFLGEKLYEACRLCDENALAAEAKAEKVPAAERDALASEAQAWRDRILDLPDPDDEIITYLPSHSPEGSESGLSLSKAIALCRRLVATHCVYGVDKNPLAVELAKLAIWLESHAEGMPLTFLDHRIVVGDSLTGPFWDRLLTWPGKPQEKLDEGIYRGLENNLRSRLFGALRYVRRLQASVGATLAEVVEKQAAKADLDEALLPFRVAAAAWSGGVMLGPEKCDDVAYAELLQQIGTTAEIPPRIESEPLRHMIARGLGVEEVTDDGRALIELVKSGRCVPALSYDLAFPEVFYPNGVPSGRLGFNVILSNPPWDRLEVKEEEYWCRYDLGILNYSDKDARRPHIEQIAATSLSAAAGWESINEAFERDCRIQQELYSAQSAIIDGRATTGRPDFYRVFAERGYHLLRRVGNVGWVLPAGFHANEGATGIRDLYLSRMDLHCCFSFENRKKLFEIDSRQKYAAIVATTGSLTDSFLCAFYLHDAQWLYGERNGREQLTYRREYVERVGGEYLTFPECRTQVEADLLGVVFGKATVSLDEHLKSHDLDFSFGVELHRNAAFNNVMDSPVFGDELPPVQNLTLDAQIPVFRGKAFWQFSDRGEYPVDTVAPVDVVLTKNKWNPGLAFFRIVFRETASATNERTLICAILRPGFICNHKAGVEVKPYNRSNNDALALLGIFNSYFADWQVRQKAGTNVSAFVLRATRIPKHNMQQSFLTHNALRLTCNHSGYAPLWREQLGESWRESGRSAFSWPVLAGDDERWGVRTAIDAVVADAYGLSREQYAHVLSTFTHASYLRAPELCLAAFDELKQIGLEAFTKKYDPYWDIPLNENLPQPVIDLPIPDEDAQQSETGEFSLSNAPARTRRRRAR